MKIEMRAHNQWFASVWVVKSEKKAFIEFKVDNGCNGLVLNHKTLNALGVASSIEDLAKFPEETGTLASGEKTTFKKLGAVSLFMPGKKAVHICKARQKGS